MLITGPGKSKDTVPVDAQVTDSKSGQIYSTKEEDLAHKHLYKQLAQDPRRCPLKFCKYYNDTDKYASDIKNHLAAHFYCRVCACGAVFVSRSRIDQHQTIKGKIPANLR